MKKLSAKGLAGRNFLLVVIGQIISLFGSAILRFALSLYVLDITGREDVFATIFAISNIPILLAPLGGAIADRFNRRNLMVIFDFLSSFLVLGFTLLLSPDRASIILIGILMVLLSTISAMYTPAVMASIPMLVEEHQLETANGIVQAVQSLAGVIAPILGGVLYGIVEIGTLLYVSCAAFFLSAVMEIFIKIPFTKRAHNGGILGTIMADIKEGFLYVIQQPFILKTMILAALFNLILTPLLVVGSPILLRVTIESTDTMYGLGMGIIELATILGAVLVGVVSTVLSMKILYRWILAIAVLLLPMALSVSPVVLKSGFYPAFILFMFCVVPIAMIMTVISIFIITKVQKKTPNENLGKVMAIVMAVAQCAAPLGQMIYGLLFQIFHASAYIPILFVSVAMLVLTVASFYFLRNENIDD